MSEVDMGERRIDNPLRRHIEERKSQMDAQAKASIAQAIREQELEGHGWPIVQFDVPVDLSTNAIDGSKWGLNGLNILRDPIAYTNMAIDGLRAQVETLTDRVTALEQENLRLTWNELEVKVGGPSMHVPRPCPCGGPSATSSQGPQHMTTCSLWKAS